MEHAYRLSRLAGRWILIAGLFGAGLCAAQTQRRFPQPEFESGYRIPTTQVTAPRAPMWDTMDTVVLIVALALVTWAVLRHRRRGLIFALSLGSLAYFGFWRRGCVCPVGAVQNVLLPVCDVSYALPLTVLIFFAAPLVVALFWGRTFCAAVCPLGCIQDLVAVRPVRLPAWFARGLSLLAYVYLGLAVLFVATGCGFLICRFDPFVAFFRRSGEVPMLVFGLAMLGLGVFIARPYCRFLCPYGVLLGWMSSFSRRHATITPSECIQCRLCEASCPFGAINRPQPELDLRDRTTAVLRLKRVLLWSPVILATGVVLGIVLSGPLAKSHPTVRLATELVTGEHLDDLEVIDRRQAFDASRQPLSDLFAEANAIRSRFAVGSPLLGLFLGMVVSVRLVRSAVRTSREGYEPDRATCFSCGRCFAYCPQEQVRRKGLPEG